MKTPQEIITNRHAKRVKNRRKELGLTQEQLAFNVGIDRTYASQIERAIANPSLSILCLLAENLNLSLEELLGGSEITPLITSSKLNPNREI